MRLILIFSFALLFSSTSYAQLLLDAEANILRTGYNDIQVSGIEGTRFEATDLDNPISFAYRFRVGYRFKNKHNVFALVAPLTVRYRGSLEQPTRFFERNFLSGVPSELNYTFNSYRLTYRYDFLTNDIWRLGAGLTGKIRDAYIELEQNGVSSKKTNVGFVPLINLFASYQPTERLGFVLDGDGLASPQGRAFDFSLTSFYRLNDKLSARLGYRILEGGADNDEVYNFTLVNYGVFGLSYNFF